VRLDEFLASAGIAAVPVDRFGGFLVEVGLPRGWETFDSAPGMCAWICRLNPCIDEF